MIEILQFDFIQRAILAGLLISVAAGVMGTLVSVNRMVFAVGGIAHAAYGGVGLGYFFGFSPAAGAVGFGLAAGGAVAMVQQFLQERRESAIGALWALGMAFGILLTDLTPGYKADLMSYLFGSLMTVSMADLVFLLVVDIVVVGITALLYARISAVCFDPVFAKARNIPVGFVNLLLYLMTAAAATAMMRLTGLVLVMALMTLPPAMAGLFVRRMSGIIVLSALFSFMFVLTGLGLSYGLGLTSGAAVVLSAAGFYLLARLLIWVIRAARRAPATTAKAGLLVLPLALLPLFLSCSGPAAAPTVLSARSDVRIVLVMLDGVRRREFFGRADSVRLAAEKKAADEALLKKAQSGSGQQVSTVSPSTGNRVVHSPGSPTGSSDRLVFANVHSQLLEQSLVYGRPQSNSQFWSANPVTKSLPAYQSIFVGFGTECLSNACSYPQRETLLDRIARVKSWPRHKTAVIASWNGIARAVESDRHHGQAFVSAGAGYFPELDSTHRQINNSYTAPEWGAARSDEQTLAHGLHYLKAKEPRFLFLSLNDADEWAHLSNYTRYVQTLREYDRQLLVLAKVLQSLPGENWLFVTTDHDRGPGARWVNHSYEPAAAAIWLLVAGPFGKTIAGGGPSFLPPGGAEVAAEMTGSNSHLDLRPTFEVLLGMPPQECLLCGTPLPEVLRKARHARTP